MTVQPFTIDIPQQVLADLQRRLARTRWSAVIDGAGWDYGTDLDYLKQLLGYWQHGYDWPAQQARLNQFAHRRWPKSCALSSGPYAKTRLQITGYRGSAFRAGVWC